MKELFKSITQSEWRFIILMSLVLVIITGVPYLYAYLVAPAGFSYNGLTSLTPADNPVYYSYINQVKQGNFLINDLFTTEPEPFGMFNVFWVVTGLIAKILLLPPALAFHLVRLLLIPVFIVAVYCFIGLFFSEPKKRKFCLFSFFFSPAWAVIFLVYSVALINFPTQYQNLHTQGLNLSLEIFTVVALFFLADKFLTPKNLDKYGLWLGNQYLAVMIFIVILAASNIFNLTRDIYYFSLKPEPVLHYFYLSQNEIAAIKHLATLVSNQQVLANDQVLSLFIPGLANQAVYLAHEIETVDYPVKAYFWQWFFGTDKQDVQKQESLVKNGIDYLFFSQSKKTPANFNPANKNYLQLVYRNAGVEIYQVTQP